MSSLASHTDEPSLRADARRNRERVIEAARAEFAERGLDAQMPDIARRAGVGVGTVYRHFPTKEALVRALARAHFQSLLELADRRLAQGGDPWEAFAGLLWESAERFVADRGLAEVASSLPDAMISAATEIDQLQERTGRLMEAARATGQLRADATPEDIPTVMCALGKVVAMRGLRASISWERYLTIMLDGLRSRPEPS